MNLDQIRADLVVKNKTILLMGDINEEMYKRFKVEISLLKTMGSPDFELEIDSTGGNYYQCRRIISEMKRYKGKITGVVVGSCDSCAFYILQNCDWRVAYECLFLCMHKIANGKIVGVRCTEDILETIVVKDKHGNRLVKKEAKRLKKTNTKIIKLFVSKSNLSFEQISKKMFRDKPYSSKKFLKWGFLDEVI
ncbi:hypothetical protein CSB11_00165 [Candidatus Campbellbacteria bacterium]|nr:MAG: hypothetical protein CSB11_00165 [Candidatus Campbellbacteria bacterium]